MNPQTPPACSHDVSKSNPNLRIESLTLTKVPAVLLFLSKFAARKKYAPASVPKTPTSEKKIVTSAMFVRSEQTKNIRLKTHIHTRIHPAFLVSSDTPRVATE